MNINQSNTYQKNKLHFDSIQFLKNRTCSCSLYLFNEKHSIKILNHHVEEKIHRYSAK